MKEPQGKRGKAAVLLDIVLALAGLTIALALVEGLMRTFPNLLPGEVRVNPPSRRVRALVDDTYDLMQSDSDLYFYMRGNIMPLSSAQDSLLAHVHMVTDANGFRNSPPEKDTYNIVALGDSFTRASGVAASWPQKLAEYTGSDVLNLGDVGFGPQDELKVLRQYGLKKKPHWVILAYFEGNDLYDAASYEQANPFISLRFGKYLLHQVTGGLTEAKTSSRAPLAADTTYRYPVTITINEKPLEMAFFSSYISWLSLSREAITASQDYHIATETILQMQELSEEAEANFVLLYVPSKEHVYLPYVNDPDTLSRVFIGVPQLDLDDAGFIQFTNAATTSELTYQYMDDQASLLADFAEQNHIRYLNLTPVFQVEAGTGAELYYAFDTHWNQHGQDLAAETINEFIK